MQENFWQILKKLLKKIEIFVAILKSQTFSKKSEKNSKKIEDPYPREHMIKSLGILK